jgi:DNA-binding NarL/FixJ family response regulator
LRSIFIESQCVIDREVRGLQQKSLGQTNGFTDSEYEILIDIALGLTDRTIAKRRSLSLRSVQNRLQNLYDKLDVYQMSNEENEDGRFQSPGPVGHGGLPAQTAQLQCAGKGGGGTQGMA